MSAQKQQKQCSLVRGRARQVSWLPARFARVGAWLRLRRDDGVWEDGWRVEAVGATREERPPRTAFGSLDHVKVGHK